MARQLSHLAPVRRVTTHTSRHIRENIELGNQLRGIGVE